jgi:hypothetical protein
MEGEVDFDDQILMPTCFSALFPRFPLVLVDETQDLSELNHAMLKKLVKGRLIGVGDRLQSIYAFRGAHHLSMDLMQEQFNMTPLELSVTFRCPQSVVREARWRAPNMKWPDWAKEGEVKTIDSWDAHRVTEQAAIICRNNAPLFAMAIKFLKAGRNCKIVGANDIGKGLIKTMTKFGPFSLSRKASKPQSSNGRKNNSPAPSPRPGWWTRLVACCCSRSMGMTSAARSRTRSTCLSRRGRSSS